MGPNVKRLIAAKMARDAIPPGGCLTDALRFIIDKDRLVTGARAATEFVEEAIKAVRMAAEPNQWKNADDEAIAGEILRRMEAVKPHKPRS